MLTRSSNNSSHWRSLRIAVRKRVSLASFTLLEVMVAVAIMALIMVSIVRFVQVDLRAIHYATEVNSEKAQLHAFVDYVQMLLEELPSRGQNTLVGISSQTLGVPTDQMQWFAKAGPAILTNAASGDFVVTLAIQPPEVGDKEWAIGIRRRAPTTAEKDYEWITLMQPASALEIRYYDWRQKAWVERWNDASARPSLIRLRIWKNANDEPYEAIMTLPVSRVRQ